MNNFLSAHTRGENFLLSFLILWFLLFSTSFIAPNSLDSWNLINNTLRFERFSTYFDTTGVGFSVEAMLHTMFLLFGAGTGFLIASLAFYIIFCLSLFKIYFNYSSNYFKTYIVIILSIPFSIVQIGGFYWDHIGLYSAVILLYLFNSQKEFIDFKNLIFISFLSTILFFSKQNSGLIFLLGIFFIALITKKRVSFHNILLLILISLVLSLFLHFFSFGNLNLIETVNFHLKTMFFYTQDNPLDSGRLDLSFYLFFYKLFPFFNPFFSSVFYPLATPFSALVTFTNLFVIFKSIKHLFLRDRSDLFLYLGLVTLHYLSVIFWGRNWDDTQSLLPLIFFLSIGKEISLKKILPILLIFFIFCFIFFRGIYHTFNEPFASPIKPLLYSFDVKSLMDQNLSRNIDLKELSIYLNNKSPDCIFTIGAVAYPFISYGKEICSDRVQLEQSRAVLRETSTSLAESFYRALKENKKILVLDSCYLEESICREKNDKLFYEKMSEIYSTSLNAQDVHQGIKIYHNLKK